VIDFDMRAVSSLWRLCVFFLVAINPKMATCLLCRSVLLFSLLCALVVGCFLAFVRVDKNGDDLNDRKEASCRIPVLANPILDQVVNDPPYVYIPWRIKEKDRAEYTIVSYSTPPTQSIGFTTLYVNNNRSRIAFSPDNFSDDERHQILSWMGVVCFAIFVVFIIGRGVVIFIELIDERHIRKNNASANPKNDDPDIELALLRQHKQQSSLLPPFSPVTPSAPPAEIEPGPLQHQPVPPPVVCTPSFDDS
jgi:hypothetical protein